MILQLRIEGPVTIGAGADQYEGFVIDIKHSDRRPGDWLLEQDSIALKTSDVNAVLDDLPHICRGILNHEQPIPC